MVYGLYNPYGYYWKYSVPTVLPFRQQPPLPTVETKDLKKSALKFQQLMNDARLFINQVANSPKFAYDLMQAAQRSDKQKVRELIRSTGVKSKVTSRFNPDGIFVNFSNADYLGDCCSFQIGLRW